MEHAKDCSNGDVSELESTEEVFKRTFSRKYLVSERSEISNLVRCRMLNLNLPTEDYEYSTSAQKRGTISYVIINPSFDLKLELGDVIYVLKPSLPILKSFNRSRRNLSASARASSPVPLPTTTHKKKKKIGQQVTFSEDKADESDSTVPSPPNTGIPTFTVTTPESERAKLGDTSSEKNNTTVTQIEANDGVVV